MSATLVARRSIEWERSDDDVGAMLSLTGRRNGPADKIRIWHMSERSWMEGPPQKILLATDLSARCDRALDRAVLLAQRWAAQLVVVHVLEDAIPSDMDDRLPSWRRPPDPTSIATRQLLADLGTVAVKTSVLIEQGRPAEVIARVAETEGCGLIVVGIARDELLGRFRLGQTVDRLLRASRIPLLVVRNRPRKQYDHIVVATDFSDSSRHALDAAAQFFKGQKLHLFHAYEAPMEGTATNVVQYRQDHRRMALEELDNFLKGADVRHSGIGSPEVFVELGDPDELLYAYARERDADLVVLGTHGRSGLMGVLLGSVAKRIMNRLPCDALVVREPRASAEA